MKDSVIHALIANGEAAVMAVASTGVVEEARQIQHLSPVCTAALGRLLSAGILMGAGLKSDSESLSITVNGGGPAGNLVVVAHGGYAVKGYIDYPYTDLPPRADGKLDVGKAVGSNGTLTVIRSRANGEPYIGKVSLVSGEIAEDIAAYYMNSEQQPNAVLLGVLVERDLHCALSAGLVISPMPGCPEEVLQALEQRIIEMGSITTFMGKYESLEEMLHGEFDALGNCMILERGEPRLECDCSKERMESVLVSLGPSEAESLLEECGEIEFICHFCRKSYAFDSAEVHEIFINAAGERDE